MTVKDVVANNFRLLCKKRGITPNELATGEGMFPLLPLKSFAMVWR